MLRGLILLHARIKYQNYSNNNVIRVIFSKKDFRKANIPIYTSLYFFNISIFMYKYINRTNRKEYMYNSLPRYSNPYLILHSSGNYKKSRHRLTNRKENKILVPHSRIHRTQSSTYKFIDRNVRERERERKVSERWSHQLLVRRTPCINWRILLQGGGSHGIRLIPQKR